MFSEEVAAIVVAGGSSRRMGFDKIRADLCGQPVLLHCLETFQECPEIGQIVLVVPAASVSDFRIFAESYFKISDIISGGSERAHSVQAGLGKVNPRFPWVAVHDAARPLLSRRDLLAVISAAKTYGAACLATPVADTLQRGDTSQCIAEGVSRENLWSMQTPQVFFAERLRMAYEKSAAAGEVFTDDASAVAKMGDAVKLIPPRDLNFKITYSCDIDLARAALALRAAEEK